MKRRKRFIWFLASMMVAWVIQGILVPEAGTVVSQSRIEGGTNDAYHPLKIVSYNIHIGKNPEGQYDLEHTIETLRGLNADIIGLQEVERNSPRTQFDDQAAQIAQGLGMEYRFEPGLKMWKFEFGNLLLSKYPILGVERIDLPSSKEDRTGLLAHLDIKGEKVAVLVTHLGLKREERSEHARTLADALRVIQQPLLVLGDFNTSPQDEQLRPLFNGLKMATEQPVITFPALGRQIDLIAHSSHFALKNAYTVQSTASDHLPLVAELHLETR